MGRLILVEGIPGSGKTTIAQRIAGFLSDYKPTNFYQEGDAHPADLAWCACIPKERFEEIIDQFPTYEQQMKQHMYEEDGYFIVPYTRFPIEDKAFYQRMEDCEVYNKRVGFKVFSRLHRNKWKRFAKETESKDGYTVFECAFLQNHINELLLYHNKTEDEIEQYLIELIGTVKELDPVLIYLNQPNVRETIRRVSDVRIDEKGNKDWMEMVIFYTETCPYGKQQGLKGFDGMVELFKARKKIELKVIEQLPIETHIINNPDYNWDEVWHEVKGILKDIVV